jgi:hypothetical protein
LEKWLTSALGAYTVIDTRPAACDAVADYPLRWSGGSDLSNTCLDPRGLVTESADNTVAWLGEGEYPRLPLPPGWTLTRDRRVWERALPDWKPRHAEPRP